MRPATFHCPIDAPLRVRAIRTAKLRLHATWLACRDPDAAAFIATARNYLCRAEIAPSDQAREAYVARALEALRMGQPHA